MIGGELEFSIEPTNCTKFYLCLNAIGAQFSACLVQKHLPSPSGCPQNVYEVMQSEDAEDRPSFEVLCNSCLFVAHGALYCTWSTFTTSLKTSFCET
jgi:hypothetical protein